MTIVHQNKIIIQEKMRVYGDVVFFYSRKNARTEEKKKKKLSLLTPSILMNLLRFFLTCPVVEIRT